MAGDTPKSSAAATSKRPNPPSSSTPNSNSHRQNPTSKPSPKPAPKPYPAHFHQPESQRQPQPQPQLRPQPPPPTYGFQMLDRRTIVLADGSVRSYFALPPDYRDAPDQLRGFGSDHSLKRKFDEDRDRDRDRDRQKQHVLQYGNAGAGPGPGPSGSSPFNRREEVRPAKLVKLDVDPAVIKSFLRFVKVIYENGDLRRNLLDNGRHSQLKCLACSGSSKHFQDVHSLVMHTHKPDNVDSHVDHLGLHRALCAIMGWNCMRPPDNSRMYQFLPADEAAAFQDDLIMWPPMVIIHNTNTGKGKDGRMEGLGNKAMDSKLRDLGFSGGKSKSLYNREGHLGITLIKFASDQLGLKEAMRLSDHFEKDRHGRRDWTHVQSTGPERGQNDDNPNLVMLDKRTGEKTRILYGYLLTASDLDKVDPDTRKKVVIESKLEKLHASK